MDPDSDCDKLRGNYLKFIIFKTATITTGMETFMKADIFFFVTTIAVVVITAGIIFALFHLAQFLSTCNRIAKNIETSANEVSNDAKDMVARVKESFLFRLMFPEVKPPTRKALGGRRKKKS